MLLSRALSSHLRVTLHYTLHYLRHPGNVQLVLECFEVGTADQKDREEIARLASLWAPFVLCSVPPPHWLVAQTPPRLLLVETITLLSWTSRCLTAARSLPRCRLRYGNICNYFKKMATKLRKNANKIQKKSASPIQKNNVLLLGHSQTAPNTFM